MYLADKDIRALLPQMELQCPKDDHQFEADEQIQPCSVDLRISNIFWRPSRGQKLKRLITRWRPHRIDLRHSKIHDLDPLRDWKRMELGDNEFITVKPGQVVMGRIYERFRIPNGHAGKIEGRSSFARLGLAVHCTGDFINPGWEGFMPLQLFNAGPYPIRIPPYFAICQLMIVRLTDLSDRAYGAEDLSSKYQNDDGGPSLWWRDDRVRALQKRLGEIHATEGMQRKIIDRVRFENPDVLERFQNYVRGRKVDDVDNADELLKRFAEREDRWRMADRVALAAPVLLASGLISSVFAKFAIWHVILIVGFVLSLGVALFAYVRQANGYLGKRELQAQPGHPPNPS